MGSILVLLRVGSIVDSEFSGSVTVSASSCLPICVLVMNWRLVTHSFTLWQLKEPPWTLRSAIQPLKMVGLMDEIKNVCHVILASGLKWENLLTRHSEMECHKSVYVLHTRTQTCQLRTGVCVSWSLFDVSEPWTCVPNSPFHTQSPCLSFSECDTHTHRDKTGCLVPVLKKKPYNRLFVCSSDQVPGRIYLI